jgi:hypothetical protein
VFLCNALPLSGQAIQSVERYARGGGVLAIFPGDGATLADYAPWSALPGQPAAIRVSPPGAAARALRLLDPQDPLFFSMKLPPGTVPSVALQRYLAFDGLADGAVAVLAAGEKEPFLLSRAYGAGRVLLFAASADRSWSNFPLSPFFLPVCHQVVLFGSGRANRRLCVQTGPVVSLAGIPGRFADGSSLTSPDGRVLAVRASREGEEEDIAVEDATEPGYYTVAGEGGPGPVLAANLDRRESELTPVKSETIPAMMERRYGLRNVAVSRSRAELEKQVTDRRVGRPLAEGLLWLGLLLAAAEMFLASRAAGAGAAGERRKIELTPAGRLAT